ncbi:MAG: type II toxin-antitoxin system VapC family toxin [Balneolaceae bacterium]
MILLDTHIWLWWLLGDGALKKSERNALDEAAEKRRISISWITIWETEMLERKERITLLPDIYTWIKSAVSPDYCTVLPVDTDLVLTQRKLPESFHTDPADRLIATTSMYTGYPLATYDQRIRESGACTIWEL